jgi:hypothetical protein
LALGLQEQHKMNLLDLLELLVDQSSLDVLGLVCLCACSRASKSATTALLAQRAVFLLPSTVMQAAEAASLSNRCKRVAAMQLLLDGAASRQVSAYLSTPAAAAQYIRVRNMPLVVAKALLAAGMQLSFDRLMQAVRAHTAGVEVWVQAIAGQPPAVKTALQAGLPPWVEQLCCNPYALVRNTDVTL